MTVRIGSPDARRAAASSCSSNWASETSRTEPDCPGSRPCRRQGLRRLMRTASCNSPICERTSRKRQLSGEMTRPCLCLGTTNVRRQRSGFMAKHPGPSNLSRRKQQASQSLSRRRNAILGMRSGVVASDLSHLSIMKDTSLCSTGELYAPRPRFAICCTRA